jgi:hypothetical protein
MREEQRARAGSRGGQGRLGAGVAAAHDDDIEPVGWRHGNEKWRLRGRLATFYGNQGWPVILFHVEPRHVPRGTSLPDAKPAEDFAEQIVGSELTGDRIQPKLCEAQLFCQ